MALTSATIFTCGSYFSDGANEYLWNIFFILFRQLKINWRTTPGTRNPLCGYSNFMSKSKATDLMVDGNWAVEGNFQLAFLLTKEFCKLPYNSELLGLWSSFPICFAECLSLPAGGTFRMCSIWKKFLL